VIAGHARRVWPFGEELRQTEATQLLQDVLRIGFGLIELLKRAGGIRLIQKGPDALQDRVGPVRQRTEALPGGGTERSAMRRAEDFGS